MKNNISLDPKELIRNYLKVLKKLQKYLLIASFVLVLSLYGFLVLQISNASQSEPNQDEITLQLSKVKRLRIDQESIDKIQQLQDQNVVVQSLFEEARNNPFKE